jgi:hypothetical protein
VSVRAAAVALAVGGLALAGCPRAQPRTPPPTDLGAGPADSELDRRLRLVAELQDEVLTSYERDELPDVETAMIPAAVGPARIGVGPGDVYFGEEVRLRASSRWPIQLPSGVPWAVRSKRLDIHLSQDRQVSAAWVSDELSWRIMMCGRTAVMPLRLTALYAHDGDRWVQVFEHLSFGRVPLPTADGSLRGKNLVDPREHCPPPPAPQDRCPRVTRALADELSGKVAAVLSGNAERVRQVVAIDPRHATREDPRLPAPTFLLAPDPDGEWHGDEAARIRMIDGRVALEDRRVGTVGPDPGKATVAFWVGNFVADLRHHAGTMASKVKLRGTFVFEKRGNAWIVVQGHLSQPIDDLDLASEVFGTALISEKPLQVTCDDGRRGVVEHGVPKAPVPAARP